VTEHRLMSVTGPSVNQPGSNDCAGALDEAIGGNVCRSSARVVEHMRGLKPYETAVRAGKRKSFCVPVDGFTSQCMLENDSLIPAVPLLVSAKGTADPSVPAPEKSKIRFDINP
jgi:hypothetical protein